MIAVFRFKKTFSFSFSIACLSIIISAQDSIPEIPLTETEADLEQVINDIAPEPNAEPIESSFISEPAQASNSDPVELVIPDTEETGVVIDSSKILPLAEEPIQQIEEPLPPDEEVIETAPTLIPETETPTTAEIIEYVRPTGPFAEEESHFEFLSILYASEAKQTGGLFGRFAASNEEVYKYRLKEYNSYLKIYFPEAYSDVVQNYIIQTYIQLQNWSAMEAELYKYLFLYPHSTIKESMLEKTLGVIQNERDLREDSERITNNVNEIPAIEDMAERYYRFLTKLSSMKRFQTSAIFRREAWTFLNRYSNTFYAGQVLVWLAENERVSENYQNAYALYDKILILYPVNPEVVTALYSQGFLLQESFSEYENAIGTYRQFLERFPNDSLNVDVQNRIATIYDRDLKDMENAITEYEVLATKYTDSKKAMKGLMRMGDIQATKLKQINEAITTYNRVASIYAENQNISVKALKKAGELHEKAKDYEKAIGQFMMVHYIYPGTTNDLEILERCATLYNKRLKNKDKAVETLNIIIDKFPGTKNAEKAKKLVKKLTK